MTHRPVWRTGDEIAVLFGVAPRTVARWAYRGHITNHGSRYGAGRYDLTEVLDWWENRRGHTYADLRAHRD